MTKRRGYTLTELLTTITIIAILATVTIVGFVMYIDRSHNGKADTEFAQMNKAFEGSYITGGLFYIGTDGNYDVYLEKLNGITYVTVLPQRGVSYNAKELESITLTDYADDFKGLSGTLTCTLAKGFYDDYTVGDKHYYRTLCDLKYTTEEGIERNFILNDKPKEQLKVILETKMIEDYIISLLKSSTKEVDLGKSKTDLRNIDVKLEYRKKGKEIKLVTEDSPLNIESITITTKDSGLARFTGKIYVDITPNSDKVDINASGERYYHTVTGMRYTDESGKYSETISPSIQ